MSNPRASRSPVVSLLLKALMWALILFLVLMAVGNLIHKDFAGFGAFLIFAVLVLFSLRPPKWLQRFSE